MEDLAQTVMEKLRADDGAKPFVVIATFKSMRAAPPKREDYVVVPIVKNGVSSYNLEVQRSQHYFGFEEEEFANEWSPKKMCNFATAQHAARFLLFLAKDRYLLAGGKPHEKAQVPLRFGQLDLDLVNQPGTCYDDEESVVNFIDMCGSMRPPVDA
jgi:hypothetical protein